jgi:hypothetical protein
MKQQVSVSVKTEIGRIEDSLLSLMTEFAQYRLQLARAYAYAQNLLAHRAGGFSSSEHKALFEATLDDAIYDYLQLRGQIDWWLEQAHQIIDALMEIERREASMDVSVPELDQQQVLTDGFEEGPTTSFIDLGYVF